MVGAPFGLKPNVAGNPADDSGALYVFQRTGTVWNQQQKRLAGDAADADEFGSAVAIHEEMVVAGSPADDDNSLANSGSVYSYQLRPTDIQKLVSWEQRNGASFGSSGVVDGDWVVVGAPGDDVGSLFGVGSAYVFKRDGEFWNRFQKLTASVPGNGDRFGGDE